MTSLLLGTDTKASLSLALNANPRGFQIITHNPTDNLHTSKSLSLTCPIYQRSHQSKVYLTIPGSGWEKHSIISSLVLGYQGILSIDLAHFSKRSDSYPISTCNFPLSQFNPHSIPYSFVSYIHILN